MIETRVENHIPELFAKLETAVSRFVQTTAAGEITGSVRAAMTGPKSGRLYGSHRASAPGESPASRSGRYLAGIEVIRISTLEAKVGARVPYAPILENEMNRPLWNKTMAEILPTLDGRLSDAIAGI